MLTSSTARTGPNDFESPSVSITNVVVEGEIRSPPHKDVTYKPQIVGYRPGSVPAGP